MGCVRRGPGTPVSSSCHPKVQGPQRFLSQQFSRMPEAPPIAPSCDTPHETPHPVLAWLVSDGVTTADHCPSGIPGSLGNSSVFPNTYSGSHQPAETLVEQRVLMCCLLCDMKPSGWDYREAKTLRWRCRSGGKSMDKHRTGEEFAFQHLQWYSRAQHVVTLVVGLLGSKQSLLMSS